MSQRRNSGSPKRRCPSSVMRLYHGSRSGDNLLERVCRLDQALHLIHTVQGDKSSVLKLLLQQSKSLLLAEAVGIWSIQEGGIKPVLLHDWPTDSNLSHNCVTVQCCSSKSNVITVPLNYKGFEKETLLAIVMPLTTPPSRWHRTALLSLARHAVLALGQRDLLEASQKRADSLEVLNHIGRVFASTLNLEDLFSSIYHETSKIMVVDVFFVALYHENTQEIEMAYIYESGKRLPAFRSPLNEGPTSMVIKDGQSMLFNVEDSIVPGAQRFGSPDTHTKSLMMVPVTFQDDVLGAISVQSCRFNQFDEDDLQLLSTIARQAAIAIKNAKLYEQTLEQATTDNMTGLMNRLAFYSALENALGQAKQEDSPLSIVMVDSDSLKSINDRFGHSAGDEHIKNMARIVQENVQQEDVVCRYGGDELVIMLPGKRATEALAVAERVLCKIRSTDYVIQGEMVQITASAGVAEYPFNGTSQATLLNAADRATYRAKNQGRNCACM